VPASLIATASKATLKLDNQKNGWKGIYVYHESNGHCPVRALALHYLHLCDMSANSKTFLSAHYDDKGQHSDITNKDVSKALKAAAMVLDYPTAKGILVDCKVEALTPSPWRVIWIPKFKRWGGGRGLP
jgi:hypothetical protein